MKLALAVAMVAGCANNNANVSYQAHVDSVLSAPHKSAAEIAAPNALEPKPWKVGQWALYKRRHGNDIGYERLSVVADDPCGIWIEQVVQQYDGRSRSTFCVRVPNWPNTTGAELQVLIVQRSRAEPEVFDFRKGHADHSRFDHLVSQVSASWRNDFQLPRETVRVPRGRFSEAVKVVGADSIRWSHPDVPFDGMVKEQGSIEKELLEYSDSGATSVLPELAEELRSASKPKQFSQFFFGLGFGLAWIDGTEMESSRANAFAGHLGLRVAPVLDLLAVVGGRDAPDQGAAFGLLAMRWSPFRSAFYLQGGVGYGELERGTRDNARGFVASVALGLLTFRGHDWTVGAELTDQLAVYNSREGVRNSVGLNLYYQLHFPRR